MAKHHNIPRSRHGPDDDWNLVELSDYEHAYTHAVDFVLFESAPWFDCRHKGWPQLPDDLREAVLKEQSRRRTKLNTGKTPGNAGMTWFYNPTTKHHVMCESCPSGYVPGRVLSEETKLRQSQSKRGALNSFYGRKHTQEAKSKIGRKGWFWVHNDLGERRQLPPNSTIPTGFNLGVGPRKQRRQQS